MIRAHRRRLPRTRPRVSRTRRRVSRTHRLFPGLVVAASTSFLMNCAVGALAAHPRSRAMMRRVRWAHHALYISTASLTGAAAVGAIVTHHPARNPLVAAHVPLALMPRFRGRSRMHVITATATAPAFVLALRRALTTPRARALPRTRPHARRHTHTRARALTRSLRRT